MDNMIFLFAAYSATWLVFFVYLCSLWKKQNRLAREIEKLKKTPTLFGSK